MRALVALRDLSAKLAALLAMKGGTSAPSVVSQPSTAAPASPSPAGAAASAPAAGLTETQLEEKLYEVLAQTDCAGCGYDNCQAYAHALATGAEKDTTLCISGDDDTPAKLAALIASKSKSNGATL